MPDGTPPAASRSCTAWAAWMSDHQPYCSGVCCSYAFKFNHLVRKQTAGEPDLPLLQRTGYSRQRGVRPLPARQRRSRHPVPALRRSCADLRITGLRRAGTRIDYRDAAGAPGEIAADMVVLCPAMVGAIRPPFLEHASSIRRPTVSASFRNCMAGWMRRRARSEASIWPGPASPPWISGALSNQGMAAAGYVLSGLAEGKKLKIEPITAAVDEASLFRMPHLRQACAPTRPSASPGPAGLLRAMRSALPRLRDLRGGVSRRRYRRHIISPIRQIFAEMEAALQ